MRNIYAIIFLFTLIFLFSCGKKTELDRYDNSNYPREEIIN